MTLTWQGDKLKRKMESAEIKGVNATMAACAVHAKRHHPWVNRFGFLERSIGIVEHAKDDGRGVRGLWGSQDIVYAIFQELGTKRMMARPYLRPAADAIYPSLARRIKRALAT